MTSSIINSFTPKQYPSIHVDTGVELVEELKNLGLWEITPEEEIPPVLVNSYPSDLRNLQPIIRKKAFLHSLLPVAMVALSEIEGEREAFTMILDKINDPQLEILFTDGRAKWQTPLSKSEIFFLRYLTKKYRSFQISKLRNRVNTVPVSLVLAQGAIESSWGGSRFVSEGNSLFGIWTWGKYGMIPRRREIGKRHKVAAYDSILDSVRAYLLMLNRVSAYRRFRAIRQQTMDSLALAEGLLYYSERRKNYISDITNVIESNHLKKYDQCVLAPNRQTERVRTISSPRINRGLHDIVF